MALFRGRTTVQSLRRAGELVALANAARQESVFMLAVVEEHAPLPTLEARVELVSLLRRVNGLVDRSAVVFEGEGFRAASVRAVVAGVSLFSRPEYPHRVFASVGSAARFLCGGRPDGPAPHRVIRMVDVARRAPGNQTFLPWLQDPLPSKSTLRPR